METENQKIAQDALEKISSMTIEEIGNHSKLSDDFRNLIDAVLTKIDDVSIDGVIDGKRQLSDAADKFLEDVREILDQKSGGGTEGMTGYITLESREEGSRVLGFDFDDLPAADDDLAQEYIDSLETDEHFQQSQIELNFEPNSRTQYLFCEDAMRDFLQSRDYVDCDKLAFSLPAENNEGEIDIVFGEEFSKKEGALFRYRMTAKNEKGEYLGSLELILDARTSDSEDWGEEKWSDSSTWQLALTVDLTRSDEEIKARLVDVKRQFVEFAENRAKEIPTKFWDSR